jgi:thiol-disulfide isomerase/thioredoxin
MRKSKNKILILGILLIIVLLTPAVGHETSITEETHDGTIDTSETNFNSDIGGTRQTIFTHTVFAEYFTTGWCTYCPSAASKLENIYNSNNYPFLFVSMILEDDQMNSVSSDAADRANEFGVDAYPTVEFDGGYYEMVGDPAEESDYEDAITTSGPRDVVDLDLELNAEDLGDAEMKIKVKITNNVASAYSGTLRVYIAEIVSRYMDFDGEPFTFGFLDFAIDKSVDIGSSGVIEESTTWVGSDVTDDLGNDFGDIDY